MDTVPIKGNNKTIAKGTGGKREIELWHEKVTRKKKCENTLNLSFSQQMVLNSFYFYCSTGLGAKYVWVLQQRGCYMEEFF